jgi:hypothetical protein
MRMYPYLEVVYDYGALVRTRSRNVKFVFFSSSFCSLPLYFSFDIVVLLT